MLRSTRRGLETWRGRDGVTLADERASQQGTQTSAQTGAPVPDPTDERGRETERLAKPQAAAPFLDSTNREISPVGRTLWRRESAPSFALSPISAATQHLAVQQTCL